MEHIDKRSAQTNPWNRGNTAQHIAKCQNNLIEKEKQVYQGRLRDKYLIEKEKLKCPSCGKYRLVPPAITEKNNTPNTWYNQGKELTTFRNHIMCPCIYCPVEYLRYFECEHKVHALTKHRHSGKLFSGEIPRLQKLMFNEETETFGRDFDCKKMTVTFFIKNEQPFEIELDV
jgi:hypothetical protein